MTQPPIDPSARIIPLALLGVCVPLAAFAQAVVTSPVTITAAPTVDFTALAVAAVGGMFSVIGIVATALINSRMKDKQAAQVLSNAVGNALGAVNNAATAAITSHPLQAKLPAGTPPEIAAGVQYVLNNAGTEATRLGVTPDAIADKIDARLGLTPTQATTNAATAKAIS